MATYTQDNRPVRADCVLGPNGLLLLGFFGSEGISTPFEFIVDLLSEDPAIDGKKLLRTQMTLELDLPNGEQRLVSGSVRKFEQLGRQEELTSYRAHIVPALWYLTLEQDCRIFQNQTVLEILSTVLQESDVTRVDDRCVATYASREYCVQYRESDFAFISRLMEEEGIFYFFEHTPQGDVLVLGDAPSAFTSLPNSPKAKLTVQSGPVMGEDVITSLSAEQSVHTGKVTLRDYDPLQPSLTLEGNVAGKEPEEWYDYPGKFAKIDDGNRYAKLLLEHHESTAEVIRGSGSVRDFTPGYKFDLTGHYRRDLNKAYTLLRVTHSCSGVDYLGRGEGEYSYVNEFIALPAQAPYRPPCVTPRPVVRGTQSAVVVGPAGEEIHVDKHGRVKVQFFWDRLGQRDDKSSCWVRCSTAWGGKGWGMISIPRIGQEVLVDFFEGDPDQPVIVGRVYNAEQVPPYPLPGGMVVSGGKSQTHKGSGYNEMSMDDTAGKEKVTIHAQYDMNTTVEHDQTNTVNNKFTETIKSDTSITVTSGTYSHDVAGDTAKYHVSGDLTENYDAKHTRTVGGDQTLTTNANRTTTITGNDSLTVNGTQSLTIVGDETLNALAKRTSTVMGDDTLTVMGKLTATVLGEVSITSPAKITLAVGASSIEIAPAGITLTCGGSVVKLDPATVGVTAPKISLNG